jgi:membrane-bound metal-dependent hydrolase YbcI (DUF457 family)
MILFGHIGITTLLGSLLSLSVLAVFIGALLPDAIDKTLYLLGLTATTRFIGHTLFLSILIPLIVYVILRKKLITLSLSFGYWLHLLEDATRFVPWFYPFISYDFSAHLIGSVFTPFNIASEIVGIVMFIYVIKTNPHFRDELNKIFKIFNFKPNGRKILKQIKIFIFIH